MTASKHCTQLMDLSFASIFILIKHNTCNLYVHVQTINHWIPSFVYQVNPVFVHEKSLVHSFLICPPPQKKLLTLLYFHANLSNILTYMHSFYKIYCKDSVWTATSAYCNFFYTHTTLINYSFICTCTIYITWSCN